LGRHWLYKQETMKIGLALPSRRTDKLIFIQELMSKEKFQYGVYTEGNWRSVLDDEEDRRERTPSGLMLDPVPTQVSTSTEPRRGSTLRKVFDR